ncbi:SPOR domain-containing protein [Pararhodonellum marinum]|uniref:SPOR domain-containing protein n=1 Tax=Pararhodonellum marinum TaxID=2755358 RepID=UPI00188F9E86|nr:SPOR domain-containing protein [Pararhodonellum marinum]
MTKEDPENYRTEDDADFGLPKVEITPLKSPEERPEVAPVMASTPVKEEKTDEIEPVTPVPPVISSRKSERRPKRRSNLWIYFLLLLVLIFGALGAWYTMYYLPDEQNNISTIPSVEESLSSTSEPENAITEDASSPLAEEAEPADAIQPETSSAPEVTSSVVPDRETAARGSQTEITSRSSTPRFFLVVGSFIDEDLALDHSKKLNAEGKNTFMIHPAGSGNYYRLAVGQFDTFQKASAEIPNYQANYKDNLWVLKY